MTRSGIRNFTLLLLLCMTISAVLIWMQVRNTQDQVQQQSGVRDTLQNEFNNLTFQVALQDKLDTLTMDERRATQLDVLTYLGLETLPIDFRIDNREARTVGDATLIVRNVTILTRDDYHAVMALVDKLYGSGKFNISTLTFNRGDETIAGHTAMELQGRLFSLEKQGPLDAATATKGLQ